MTFKATKNAPPVYYTYNTLYIQEVLHYRDDKVQKKFPDNRNHDNFVTAISRIEILIIEELLLLSIDGILVLRIHGT